MAYWKSESFPSLSGAIDKHFATPGALQALVQPNPLMVALMGHHKWYVKPLVRFQPKWIQTFTEYRSRIPGSAIKYPVDHGYWCHHPLEFLYRWAQRFATRKQRFMKCNRIEGNKVTIPLRGKP